MGVHITPRCVTDTGGRSLLWLATVLLVLVLVLPLRLRLPWHCCWGHLQWNHKSFPLRELRSQPCQLLVLQLHRCERHRLLLVRRRVHVRVQHSHTLDTWVSRRRLCRHRLAVIWGRRRGWRNTEHARCGASVGSGGRVKRVWLYHPATSSQAFAVTPAMGVVRQFLQRKN